MAKKKPIKAPAAKKPAGAPVKLTADLDPEERLSRVDTIMQASLEEVAKHTSSRFVMPLSDTGCMLLGIPLPGFALEYLLGVSCLPLNQVIIPCGEEASNKSSFVFEMMRWFQRCGGGSEYIDNEGKFSPTLAQSILKHNTKGVNFVRVMSLEESQSTLLKGMKRVKAVCLGTKEKRGPGRVIPVLFAVDSVVAKAAAKTIEKVEAEGSASLGYAIDANLINTYMKVMPRQLEGWPFVVAMINHLKPNDEDPDKMPGGKSLKFLASLILRFRVLRTKIPSSLLPEKLVHGKEIEIKTIKNSFAGDKRDIRTRILWNYERVKVNVGGQERVRTRQRTWWDWNWATTNFLVSQDMLAKAAVKEVLDLVVDSTTVGSETCHCTRLGIKKDKPVSFSEMGRLINNNREVRMELRDLFAITPVRPFDPRVDYQKQYDQLLKDNQAAARQGMEPAHAEIEIGDAGEP